MLRRFSDAALGSFEKLLNNINGVREKKSDKRRKLGGNELIDLDNDNNVCKKGCDEENVTITFVNL